ncbi:MAG: MFS transporter [Candidatus Cloacimonadota bacterium]|nr:MFS transporter [Candidatus Cloacimonadota bacterium]
MRNFKINKNIPMCQHSITPLNKKIIGWVSYDFANSSFTTVIVTVIYSVYFKNVVVGKEGLGSSLWGLAVSISMLLVALSSPILGAISDFTRSKKKFLFVFCYTSVVFTALLFFVRQGTIFLGVLLFIIANIGFEGSLVFYNAFLPEITEKKNIGKVSGLGWGIGYLGGLAALGLAYLLVHKSVTLIFPVTALFFGCFAIPIFLFVPEKASLQKERNHSYIKIGYKRLTQTFKNIKKFKELTKFLLSFFLYNDGIKTVIVFAAIYGAYRFGMNEGQLITYFVFANIASFIGSIIFGFIVDKIGAKKTISISLIIWLGVVIWAFFCPDIMQFYGVGILAGLAIGSSQSASRSMLSLFTPEDKHAEFFGFYAVSGKAAAILGPLIYGFLVLLFKSQRYAILSIAFFFVIGLIILQNVDELSGMKAANSIYRKE